MPSKSIQSMPYHTFITTTISVKMIAGIAKAEVSSARLKKVKHGVKKPRFSHCPNVYS